MEALDTIRSKLEHDLLKLQEEELELDDECAYLVSEFYGCTQDESQLIFYSGGCPRTSRVRGDVQSTVTQCFPYGTSHAKLKTTQRPSIPSVRT